MTYHTQSKETFRRQLLAADEESPALRAEYNRRFKAMFEVKISPAKKAEEVRRMSGFALFERS